MNANPPRVPGKRARFLAAYRACGSITGAARASGVDHSSHYRRLRRDAGYAAEFANSRQIASDVLEEEARRRAVEGIEVPVYHAGKVVGHRLRYSDRLLVFLLKANRPEKFGTRRPSTATTAPTVRLVIVDEAPPTTPRGGLISDVADPKTVTVGRRIFWHNSRVCRFIKS